MMPVDVMLFAMRLELECGQLRSLRVARGWV
jgi:hypothetical protein